MRSNLLLYPRDRWRWERGEEETVWGMGVISNGVVCCCKRNSNQAVLQIIKGGELVMLSWTKVNINTSINVFLVFEIETPSLFLNFLT